MDWDGLTANYDRIRDHIERVVPGFERFNERVRKAGGFCLPIPPKDRVFNTATGRAQFSVTPITPWNLKAGQFLLMTIRTHDQFNTVVYGMDDRYRGISNDRHVVFINKDDMAAAGFAEGQMVNLTSHFTGTERRVSGFSLVGYDIPRGCLAAVLSGNQSARRARKRGGWQQHAGVEVDRGHFVERRSAVAAARRFAVLNAARNIG